MSVERWDDDRLDRLANTVERIGDRVDGLAIRLDTMADRMDAFDIKRDDCDACGWLRLRALGKEARSQIYSKRLVYLKFSSSAE